MSDHPIDSLSDFLALIEILARNPATAPQAAAMSAALLHVLESGPFLAMLQAAMADGLANAPALSEQQRQALLGMATTVQEIKALFDGRP